MYTEHTAKIAVVLRQLRGEGIGEQRAKEGDLRGRNLSCFLSQTGLTKPTCPLPKWIKLIYMKKRRKSKDFRCFVSEIVGNMAAISAWITPMPGKYQCAVWDFSSFFA